MKLRALSMHPFAGFAKKEIGFAPGLNVVLGPNDVGKTTVFRAIEAALFLPAKLSRSTKEGRDLLPRVLPLGGDHARLSLEFDGGGAAYRLEKSWGQGAGVLLEGAAGTRLLQEEKIELTLRGLLGLPAGTFQSVLFMGQGALENTVSLLAEKRDSLHTLGDLLRHAVDQTAGISVELLKHKLAARIEEAFAHWDAQNHLPDKGKGIEDEWKKNVGTVLSAYYAKEKLKRDARLAQALETERDTKLASLAQKQASRGAARDFVRDNEKFVAAASERQTLDSKADKARSEADAMLLDLGAWMRAESDRRSLSPEVVRLEARRTQLEEELKAVLGQSKKRELLTRFEKVREARARAEEAGKALAALPALKPEDFKRLRFAFQECDRLKNSQKSGKLRLQFHVRESLDVVVRKDFEAERKGLMAPGKPMTISAGGRIQLRSPLFELEVLSGDGNIAEVEEQLGRANDALGKIQAELKVSTLEEAQVRADHYAEALQGVRSREAVTNGLLAPGEKYEDLERRAGDAGAGQGENGREPELVQAELQLLLRDLGSKKEGLVRCESLQSELGRRHGVSNSDKLMEKMVAKKTELGLVEAKLAALPALPERLGQLEDFLPRFRRAQLEDGALGEEIRTLSVELAELKARLPEQSAQDLERARLEAEASFQRELSRGRALLRIEAAVKTVESKGVDLYAGFRAEFEKKIDALSRGKYRRATMQEALPDEFERRDGALVKYAWLSSGTKDAFALALRLSMAQHFLGNREGFLLVDDPLVNMDPERQGVAAEMLREFAGEKQVVVFTCHPAHAALLGGHCVEM